APAGLRESRKYFPELESLRGLAILLVFAYHADGVLVGTKHHASPLLAFARAGHTGVALFFILSGFLLSLPFLAEAAGGKRQARRAYYVRRALRILPLYWTAVIVSTALSVRSLAGLNDAWPFLIFAKALTSQYALWPYSIGWWSLATEVQFYLLLPLLPLLARSRRRLFCALAVYALAYGTFVARLWHLPSMTWNIDLYSNVFGRAPLFMWGIFAAWLYRTHGTAIRERLAATPWIRRGGADVALAATFVALGYLLRWAVIRGFWDLEVTRRHPWHVVEGALWASILLLLLLAPLRTKRVLANPVLGAIGIVSFSLFIIHIPVVALTVLILRGRYPDALTAWNPGSAALMAAVFVACLAASVATYWTIERPFLVRKARLDR
ncbi:MAG TPA: acyltransferase, partial [Usitatibacter sp.]|nr:acyltransferase [Usitatibacter sp.]